MLYTLLISVFVVSLHAKCPSGGEHVFQSIPTERLRDELEPFNAALKDLNLDDQKKLSQALYNLQYVSYQLYPREKAFKHF